MSVDLKGIVTWLKGWFYDKDEVNTIANSKVNLNQGQANKNVVTNASGQITVEDKPVIPDVSGKIDTAGTGLSKSGTTLNHSNSITAQTSNVFKKFKYDAQGHITGTANVTASDLPSHNHSIANVTNLQSELNSLDSRIDSLESIEFVKVVQSKPDTASAETMNILWVVANGTSYDVWITVKKGSTYEWNKIDQDILDDLSIDWSDIENNPFSSSTPSSFANASHSHGNITNDGKLGSDSGQILITTTNGVISSTSVLESGQINYRQEGNPISLTVLLRNMLTDIANVQDSAPTNHSSQYQTYGVGTTLNYGHCKIVNDLNTNSYSNGAVLSAYQGNVLNQAIQGKQDIGDCITSIELIPKATDNTGAIKLYYGDEPT